MKAEKIIALTAAALLSGLTAASAADISSSHSGMARPISDTLSLDATQQKTAWNDLSSASAQNAPAGFNATEGATVPTALKISAVPSKAAHDVNLLGSYDFAKVNGKVLIVNPHDRKVAEVISG
jgi:Protein of unknown function (DUF1236)